MLKQFLAKQKGFDYIVSVGASLTIRALTESQAREFADKALSAYEETVSWRFDRNVQCLPLVGNKHKEWSFDLIQKK